jgi:hypothetical protein
MSSTTRSAFEERSPCVLDLNRANLSIEPVNAAINDAIERAAATTDELPRPYLGASIVGSECLRKVQYDWWCQHLHSARLREIFARGHYFERQSRQRLSAAGFKFAPPETLGFSAVNGTLRGTADGIIIAGPGAWDRTTGIEQRWRAGRHRARNAACVGVGRR